ncbi:prolipoprotein diacylglyceryl transferase [candidate division WOR-1 bacterium RIFOXYA12_FULL_52_29]|uniref:Phosphatidylglycerol--prolipoprotein diacylglyceryl transferase n=1 Tax=candidate division WOR-1 bacterium RIFOXYC12_FULL_54_18 TaxID=1802584 RepID=A0A1F4T743_UNCSA|nr:MAG: prolipoprotein diacylglyceryl transferase [candidate division WOR-1 bacterium RIFOXYA2_FULL_51_19]OGC18128.1 MAG: prolipoprotein diacylglyceryl transferase [candidate division WOR-1 bacterium RIFOXYA12_FULL_52_29]OGC26983.1 MAG: prolipoprotein diacylglyceryl transferase [candidate division WOR-1 bacterium RIFOXYB2_FULL_45_9]OGC28545.1 MAG: prolipoprotein diacylglyceryl transferase [candidate division WOR-1 bacterium RIFOXYC12_FULL_54_18]OGC31000.1 MAG: prolipoprotein diacylglyceryl tran
MHPILIKLGSFSIYSYGFMVALGFLAGIGVSLRLAKQAGIKSETIIDLALYVIIAAIVGARFFYVVGQWNFYRGNLLEIIMIQRGGMVFLGGLIFALAAVVYFASAKQVPLRRLFDAITPGTALGYAIGRLGCFLNGCCFGLPTDRPWGLVFPSDCLAGSYFPDQHLHPTQLYSSALILLAFAFLLFLYYRKKFPGQVFFTGLILYSLYRFSVEFLRYSPIHWAGLTPSQWIVIPVIAFSCFYLWYYSNHDRSA